MFLFCLWGIFKNRHLSNATGRIRDESLINQGGRAKKQGNGIIESKVGLYSIKPVHTYLSVKCQLWSRFLVRNSTS
jgi:hypothetical protein